LTKIYVQANGEVLAQHDYIGTNRCFYLHDRLGSIRQVISYMTNVQVLNSYTYGPFGEMIAAECAETIDNPFKFTGQYYDFEIGQYYLRARQYDPQLMRMTARDSIRGTPQEPMSLHRYIYCFDDPINKMDPSGKLAFEFGGSLSGNLTASDIGSLFNDTKGLNGLGALVAYNSVLLPVWTMMSDRIGCGGTVGAGFAVAWDNTKSFNDKTAWSWGTIQWFCSGYSLNTGAGAGATVDFGISNATHVSQLAGPFVEAGGSYTFANFTTLGDTMSWGLNSDGSLNGIWLGTVSVGGGSPGIEAHAYSGTAFVQEYGGF
jgi:RHS repeat-associated protein